MRNKLYVLMTILLVIVSIVPAHADTFVNEDSEPTSECYEAIEILKYEFEIDIPVSYFYHKNGYSGNLKLTKTWVVGKTVHALYKGTVCKYYENG